jgi:serine/threonine-protein kinase
MSRFGRYEILEELGQGAMGAVFKARDPVMDRVVAIKTILAHAAQGPQAAEYRERFFREARAAGRLSHPGIVTIYDVAEQEGTPFLVMEFIAGRTLESALESGERFPLEQTFDLGAQLAEALDYAHKNGVIHRDIKPANILLTADGRPKVADFGVAKLASLQVTATGQMLGTPAFMAPEQFTGAPVDGRADLFALGVILYWMATGDKPFTGDTLMAMSYKIVHTNPIPPRKLNPAISRGFELVLLKCMQKDPAERYQNGEELAQDLRALREGRPPITRFSDSAAEKDRTVVSSAPSIPGAAPADNLDTMETVGVVAPRAGATAAGVSGTIPVRDSARVAAAQPASASPHAHRTSNLRLVAITVVAIVALVGLIQLGQEWIRARSGQPQVIAPVGPQSPSAGEPKTATRDTPAKPESAAPRKASAKAETAGASVTPASDVLRLEIRAAERATLLLHPKGQPSATYQMRAGDEVKVEAKEEATLFTDNAGAVRVKLNGKELPPLGEGRTTRQVVLTPAGIDESRPVDRSGTNRMRAGKFQGFPSPGHPPNPEEMRRAITESLSVGSLGSPRVQEALARNPQAAKLQIFAERLPAMATLIVRLGNDTLFRHDAALRERGARAEEDTGPSFAPLDETRYVPSGKHRLRVNILLPGRRAASQDFDADFAPKQSRMLRISLQKPPAGGQPQSFSFVITLD